MKAFREGKQPTPGPPGGDDYMNAVSPATGASTDPDDIPSAPPAKSTPSGSNHPSSLPGGKPIPVYKPPAPSGPINFSNLNFRDEDELDEDIGYSEQDRKSISAAGKHAKFAMSALLYDDIRTAMNNLEQALALLKPIKIIEDL